MYYPNIDYAITLYMKRESITQEAFAGLMGMAPNTFSWKRRGIREWSLTESKALADILGMSLDDLTGRARLGAERPRWLQTEERTGHGI